jgi:hypothetical protein
MQVELCEPGSGWADNQTSWGMFADGWTPVTADDLEAAARIIRAHVQEQTNG